MTAALTLHWQRERGSLLQRLQRLVGCRATAEDLVQDAWVRASACVGEMDRPAAYLQQVATNLARDHDRSRRRRLAPAEVEALLEVADPAPDAEATAIGRAELRALIMAMAELPPRRRAILHAARVEGQPHCAIAAHHGVSTRTVEIELRKALDYCAARLGRRALRSGGSPPDPA